MARRIGVAALAAGVIAENTQPAAFWPYWVNDGRPHQDVNPIRSGWLLESNMSVETAGGASKKPPIDKKKPGTPQPHWGPGTIETYGSRHNGLKVMGSTRAYLAREYEPNSHDWSTVKWDNMKLLGKTLKFKIDLSNVPCNCEASVYLVEMGPTGLDTRSGYCDITGGPDAKPCVELDMLEANIKALQASIHTAPGADIAEDGTCNERGCLTNWGKDSRAGRTDGTQGAPDYPLYGPDLKPDGSIPDEIAQRQIDTKKAFELAAHFSGDGNMSVSLHQGNNHLKFFNNSIAEVPITAIQRTKAALLNGMTLAVALWTAPNMSFLDGYCVGPYVPCNLTTASFTIEDIEVVDKYTPFESDSGAASGAAVPSTVSTTCDGVWKTPKGQLVVDYDPKKNPTAICVPHAQAPKPLADGDAATTSTTSITCEGVWKTPNGAVISAYDSVKNPTAVCVPSCAGQWKTANGQVVQNYVPSKNPTAHCDTSMVPTNGAWKTPSGQLVSNYDPLKNPTAVFVPSDGNGQGSDGGVGSSSGSGQPSDGASKHDQPHSLLAQ